MAAWTASLSAMESAIDCCCALRALELFEQFFDLAVLLLQELDGVQGTLQGLWGQSAGGGMLLRGELEAPPSVRQHAPALQARAARLLAGHADG
jgi:hypothetical protein